MISVVIYLMVFITSACLVAGSKKYKNTFNIYSIIGIGILILFAAGRYHVGTDSTTYMNIFRRYSEYSWSDFFEKIDSDILFAVVAKVTYMWGGRVLTWGTFAALLTIPVYITLKKQYPDLWIGVSFLIFGCAYYSTAFNVTRQFVAVAIIFWGMKYIYTDKFIPFLLVVIVAIGFHQSAFIGIVLWFFWNHKKGCAINGTRRIVTLIVTTIIVVYYQQVISFFSSTIDTMDQYSTYAEMSTRGQNRDLLVYTVELIIILFLERYMPKKDKRISFMKNLLIVSVLIGLTGFTHPQVKRVAYYFAMPARLVLFGYLPECFTRKSQKMAMIVICGWFILIFILMAYILGEAHLIPYRFDLFSTW